MVEIRTVESKIPTAAAVSRPDRGGTVGRIRALKVEQQTPAMKALESKLNNLIDVQLKANIKNISGDYDLWKGNFRKINATITNLKNKRIV